MADGMTRVGASVTIFVDRGGGLTFVHSDDLADALRPLGPAEVARASLVEPDGRGGWTADMSPVSPGVVLGPFLRRDAALRAEAEWLDLHLGGGMNADDTEPVRRLQQAQLNAGAVERPALEAKHGQVWDADELRRDFEVLGFLAPIVVVRRRSDGQKGSLYFQHEPRLYFGWDAHRE